MEQSTTALEPLDEVLYSGLQDQKNRQLILKVESSIITFLQSKQARLEFPPLGSYQRLVVHQVAEYYCLAHATVAPTGPDNGKRVVQLARTPHTRLVPVKLKDRTDWVTTTPEVPSGLGVESPAEAAQKVAIAKPQGPRRPTMSTDSGSANTLTLEEREEAYAAARARIMGEIPSEVESTQHVTADQQNSSAGEASMLNDAMPVKAELKAASNAFDPDYCRGRFQPVQPQGFPVTGWVGGAPIPYGTGAAELHRAANTWQPPVQQGSGWQPTFNSGGWQVQNVNSQWQQQWQQQPPIGVQQHTSNGWVPQPVQHSAPPPPPPPQDPPNLWGEQFPPLSNQGE